MQARSSSLNLIEVSILYSVAFTEWMDRKNNYEPKFENYICEIEQWIEHLYQEYSFNLELGRRNFVLRKPVNIKCKNFHNIYNLISCLSCPLLYSLVLHSSLLRSLLFIFLLTSQNISRSREAMCWLGWEKYWHKSELHLQMFVFVTGNTQYRKHPTTEMKQEFYFNFLW